MLSIRFFRIGGIVREHENCHVDPLDKPVDLEGLASAMIAYLAVRGMGCPRCAMRVRNGLLSLDGVLLADVHHEHGIAAVAYIPQRLIPDDLVLAVSCAVNDGRHNYQAQFIKGDTAKHALRQLSKRLE